MMTALSRRSLLRLMAFSPWTGISWAGEWTAIEAEAWGQTIYFNAWAGSDVINDYIAWAGAELEKYHGIRLEHVKIADTAEVVRRVRDEVKAGNAEGSVDLVWINGENFHAMKREHLLFGPFAESLPNFALVDVEGKPTVRIDFAEPVEGFESPWGMAQLTFFGDAAVFHDPPQSVGEILQFAEINPGRLTYPAPPDFHGTTFLKQILAETISNRAVLSLPVTAGEIEVHAKSLWDFLGRLHPHLWRGGKQFPQSQAQMKQMLADGELLMAFTFNPNEPANLVASGSLPATVIAWQHADGTIGNTHFLAIPVNSQARAAAQVVANFMLSPEAQSRKADLKIWGDPTVLALPRLSKEQAAMFATSAVAGSVRRPAPAIPEPHGSWVPLIEAAWLERYGA